MNAGRGNWVRGSQLLVGDSVLTRRGTWKRITAISREAGTQIVYNFEVDKDHDYFAGKSSLLVHNAACFINQLPEQLEAEMAEAQGFQPISPAGEGFAELANSGEMNYVVTEEGDVLLDPNSINHSVIAGGAPVQAAGEVNIAVGEGQSIGLSINAQSGHYLLGAMAEQTAQALAAAAQGFGQYGIFF
jgi:hypothetical protein